jgi:hypothetical protein
VKTTPPWKSEPVVVIVVLPTPAIMSTTDEGTQPAVSAYRTENENVVLGVPDPGDPDPAVSVV